jgi:hypothetical protein
MLPAWETFCPSQTNRIRLGKGTGRLMTQTYAIDNCQGIAKGRTKLVRRAIGKDLPGIVAIHQKAFGNFFLTRLGGNFLRRYYALVLNYHSGIVLVSEHHGALQGFACGFVEPAEFYKLMWRRRCLPWFVIPHWPRALSMAFKGFTVPLLKGPLGLVSFRRLQWRQKQVTTAWARRCSKPS